MGYVSRMMRKFQRDEKYINHFARIIWPSIILAIGWMILWKADTQYAGQTSRPIISVTDISDSLNTSMVSGVIVESRDTILQELVQ